MTKARVLYGINNRFTLNINGKPCEAVIKGKKLKNIAEEYNALACGDEVLLDENGQIVERLPRQNMLARFNWKQNLVQTLAVNLDYAFCVVAVDSPPLHARFLDRLLIACEAGAVEPWIILTKTDLRPNAAQALEYYQKLGYGILETSITAPESFKVLKDKTLGKTVALLGASGVGKSTLINNILEKQQQLTGEINRKFKRGNHTTNYAISLPKEGGSYWIDTPGVRDFSPVLHGPLDQYYPDFAPYLGQCGFATCVHQHEATCAIRQAVEQGAISQDRYQNYCKLLEEETLKIKACCRYKH